MIKIEEINFIQFIDLESFHVIVYKSDIKRAEEDDPRDSIFIESCDRFPDTRERNYSTRGNVSIKGTFLSRKRRSVFYSRCVNPTRELVSHRANRYLGIFTSIKLDVLAP